MATYLASSAAAFDVARPAGSSPPHPRATPNARASSSMRPTRSAGSLPQRNPLHRTRSGGDRARAPQRLLRRRTRSRLAAVSCAASGMPLATELAAWSTLARDWRALWRTPSLSRLQLRRESRECEALEERAMGLEPTTLSLGNTPRPAWLSQILAVKPKRCRCEPLQPAPARWSLARNWRALDTNRELS